MDRLAGEIPPERAIEMLESGAQPLQDLIAALHAKDFVVELERHPFDIAGELVIHQNLEVPIATSKVKPH